MQPPADDHAAADARSERDADEVLGPAAGAQPQLGQRQSADVVDERDRQPERRADRAGDRAPGPVAEQVRKQRAGPGRGVEVARQREARRLRLAERRGDGAAERGDPLEHGVLAVRGIGRPDVGGEHAERRVDDRGLDVGAAEVQPEMHAHRAVHPPSTVSTLPVANGAVAR